MRRYWAEIVYDFAHELPGIRGGARQLWKEREWAMLLDLIEMLPSTSRTKARQANDDEYAEMVFESAKMAKPKDQPKPGWAPEEWTALHAMTADLISEVRLLQSITRSAFGAEWKQPVPYDRLETKVADAVRRGREASRRERHEARLDILLPNRRK